MPISNAFLRSIAIKRERVTSDDVFPFCIPAVRHLEELALHPSVTFLVGENGTGKSTLLEAMAVAVGMNAEGGSGNFQFSTEDTHTRLHEFLRIVRGVRRQKDTYFLRAESFYNVASYVDDVGAQLSHGNISLHHQSHGESFLALLQHRFRPNGLYFLDEPEAALSPGRQLAALSIIHDLVQAGSQFVIATHSPILMAYPDATLYVFSDDGIREMEYQDTEHFQVTRAFLSHPDLTMQELLNRDELPGLDID